MMSISQVLNTNRARTVGRTAEFRRIEALPRRTEWQDLSWALTLWLRVPGGTQVLWPVQAWALAEAMEHGGLMGLLPVGSGKTAVSHLLPVVLGLERPLLLVPAALREKAHALDIPLLSKHWRLHPRLTIVSYEQLSRVGQAGLLDDMQPDGIIADEAHRLKNIRTAGVARRVARYLEGHPTCFYADLSGSPAKRSIKDYSHRLFWALGGGAPVPNRYTEMEAWAGALDANVPEHLRVDPGALHLLCKPGEPPVEGFRRRLLETPGVVSSSDAGVDASLHVLERMVHVPQAVRDAFTDMRSTGATPGGEIIVNGLEFARHAREVINGMIYYWVWPPGTSPELRDAWLGARKAWKQYVRGVIKNSGRSRDAYDTEMQVAQACSNNVLTPPLNQYGAWVAIRDQTTPETAVRWVSEYMVDVVLEYLATHERALVWVEHTAMLQRLRERGALVYGAGEHGISTETRSAVVSLAAHGTGKNLQHYWDNLFIAVPTSGSAWEQTLGRTHRPGTEADEVTCEVVLSCIETWNAFAQARKDAAWYQDTKGMRQKLCYADVVVTSEDEVMRRARVRPRDPLWCADWPE